MENKNINHIYELEKPEEIEELHITNTEVSEAFFSKVNMFYNLKKLKMGTHAYKFSVLPVEIGQLGKLEILNLFRCEIKELPPEIGELENLINLNISDCRCSIPQEIKKLKKLKTLDARGNYNFFQEELGYLSELNNLEYLDLAYNDLYKLPQSFSKLKNLKYLSIGRNRFQDDVFEIIKELYALEELNLSSNWNGMSLEGVLKLSELPRLKLIELKVKSLVQHKSELEQVFDNIMIQ